MHRYRVFGILFVLSAGCRQTYPAVQYETRRAEIGTTFEFGLCQGDLDRIDETIDAIEA